MQDNGSPNNGIDIIATVISLAFSGLGGVVKYITATQSMGAHVKLSSVVSSFLVGAFSGMVVAFFLMSQSIDTLMIISIAQTQAYPIIKIFNSLSLIISSADKTNSHKYNHEKNYC